jgi:hypothetical protein
LMSSSSGRQVADYQSASKDAYINVNDTDLHRI